MKTARRASLVLALAFPASAAAIDIAWYEQAVPGDASGEIRLENLQEGDLEIETPGRRMEFGILRIGDIAIVNLAGAAERPVREGEVNRELVVVARQGAVNTRAIYQLAMPARQEPKPPAASTPSVPDPAVAAVPVIEETQPPADVDRPAANVLAPVKNDPVPHVPVVANLEPVPAKPAKPLVCPVLAIRPGSLRSNVSRLLDECGARMGEWVTGGPDGKYLTDWIVREPKILAEQNHGGLQGLLELLYSEYRLQGLPSAGAAAIDIYRTR